MKNKANRNAFIGNLEHRGGKKLSQRGEEFFSKIREVRRHPTSGFRGRKG